MTNPQKKEREQETAKKVMEGHNKHVKKSSLNGR
jgi:hypothetical protein